MNLASYTAELVERLTMANQLEAFADLSVLLLRELSKGAPVSPAALVLDQSAATAARPASNRLIH